MRALFVKDLEIIDDFSEVELSSTQIHHLKKVTRAKVGDELLLLNGKGVSIIGKISSFEKKSITFNRSNEIKHTRENNISIALAMPKKDAFEEIVQNSIQLGVKNIFTFSSEFSQYEFDSINERLSNIMIGAYQQSNNPFELVIHKTVDFFKIEDLVKDFSNLIYFTSVMLDKKKLTNLAEKDESIILIGPEGGLSEKEELFLVSIGFNAIHLPTPILKSSNAVSTTIGYLLALS